MTTLDSTTELNHRWPQFLPDGRHFLYWLMTTDREKRGVVLASLDDKPDSKDRKRLLAGSSMAAYSAGHLLFERESALMAQPFDAARLQFHGEAFPVAQQVAQLGGTQGWAAFSVSPDGTLTYHTGGGIKTQLAWFDRSGRELSRLGQPEEQTHPRISPDQKRVAVDRSDAHGPNDIWLLDLAQDKSTRFTFHPATDNSPAWSPDSSRIVFASTRDGLSNLYQKASSGAANEEPLLKSTEAKYPTDWSSDCRFILYQAIHSKTGLDLAVLPLEGPEAAPGKPIPFLQTEFNETLGQFSPDTHWIAYWSNESTPAQVYVQGFPKSGGKFQVSTNGGGWPRWRRDGKELYYLGPDRKMMAVEVKATATAFETGRPRELFQTRAGSLAAPFIPIYDVTADGQRFLINCALEAEGPPPITVVMNWAPKN
ncbi:MAG: PD40 domain-containing protein [Acidobacteria bacterium]|nr:PD40 domain-containing protein [Acidobacteriota bacterium]